MESILMSSYMSEFHCIGSKQCDNDCCNASWDIPVDSETGKQYKSIQDQKLTPLFKKYIQDQPGKTYAFLKKLPDGNCPFHSPAGLCIIQQRLGSQYLSNTCGTYPRHVNRIDGVFEMSGEVSCPEMGRLVLLNSEPIVFDYFPQDVYLNKNSRFGIYRIVDCQGMKPGWQQFTMKLRAFAIKVLQERSCSLEDRLIFLGLFFKKAQEYINDSAINQLEGLTDKYRDMFQSGNAKGLGDGMNSNPTLKLELILEMCSVTANSQPLYDKFFERVLQGINLIPEKSLAENATNYHQVYLDYYSPFMGDKGYIFENYLANFMFQKIFPLVDSDHIFEAYASLIIHYVLFQFHLVGIAGYTKNMDDRLLAKTFSEYSRCMEHDGKQVILKSILQLLREHNSYTLPHLMVLMKN